jgi:putative copper export protein
MVEGEKSKPIPPGFTDERTLTWMDEHLDDLKQQYVSGQRLLYQSLVLGFLVGLAAHIAGYVMMSSTPTGTLGLAGDLLHALGWSLWTGVVVAVFVQVIPEIKRRQIKQAVDAYEALRRDEKRA